MKKLLVLGLLAASVMVAAAVQASAQDRRLNSASAEFWAFYLKFIAAVHRRDKMGVASMTSFPLTYGFDAGDEGKYTRKEFMTKGFRRMFGKAPGKFLSTKNPLASGSGTSF